MPSHWGLLQETDSSASSIRTQNVVPMQPAALVLTEAGDVLVRKGAPGAACVVALQVGKSAVLSPAQTAKLQQAWDIALALTGGCSDDIHLQPMPAAWRFARSDYQSWEDWMGARSIAPQCVASFKPSKHVTR